MSRPLAEVVSIVGWQPSQGPDLLTGTVARQRLIQSVAMGTETLLSPTLDSVLCLRRIAHSRFLADTTYCPVRTSKSVCPGTAPDSDKPIEALRYEVICVSVDLYQMYAQ